MKIYLCLAQPTEGTSHKWVSNIAMLNGLVEDGEATSIICNHFLSTFTYDELQAALNKIVSKMRLQAELVLIHPDINIVSQKLQREDISLEALNAILFGFGAIKGAFSIDAIEKLLPSNLQVTHKHFDNDTANVIIKARRVT